MEPLGTSNLQEGAMGTVGEELLGELSHGEEILLIM
jgi:hypothetical protein